MQPNNDDLAPFPPSRFIGRQCSFNEPNPKGKPRRLVGIIESATYAGRFNRGMIPDYTLVIRGQSGKALTVSLVESYLSLTE
jgi:hypothetical protein